MDTIARLQALTETSDLESDGQADCPDYLPTRSITPPHKHKLPMVSDALMPNGKRITLLKPLLTSACERNCFYCPFRAGRDFRRVTFKPDEMAQAFVALQKAGIVQGIFLSSGIIGGGVRTQDQIIAVAELLRQRYRFDGYIHLKIMPGAEKAQVERSMQLADRVSVNLEGPNTSRLADLAPRKVFLDELLQRMRWVEDIRRSTPPQMGWKGRWPSLVTQFVVGAVGETDAELLSTTAQLHANLRLGRAYFSAFRPIIDTPFENKPAENPLREHRLYQASYLLRDYGFELEDLPFEGNGSLPLNTDPKTAWARLHLAHSPLELNRAEPGQLLRIPGIGPKGAQAILSERRLNPIKSVEDLKRIGVNPGRAAPYVLLDGRRPPTQLRLFT
jgi:predicted DNA-binding helix-hairpin-helix protein